MESADPQRPFRSVAEIAEAIAHRMGEISTGNMEMSLAQCRATLMQETTALMIINDLSRQLESGCLTQHSFNNRLHMVVHSLALKWSRQY